MNVWVWLDFYDCRRRSTYRLLLPDLLMLVRLIISPVSSLSWVLCLGLSPGPQVIRWLISALLNST